MKTFFRLLGSSLLMLLFFFFFAGVGGLGWFLFSPPGESCLSCHELSQAHEAWRKGAHHSVDCRDCHGSTIGSWVSVCENANRLFRHLTQTIRPETLRLSEDQVLRMSAACGKCHAAEYAHWEKTGHGKATYETYFLDRKYCAAAGKPADFCFRCHGMFFEGAMTDLLPGLHPVKVQKSMNSISTNGVLPFAYHFPMKFKAPLANRKAIPCLACHSMHGTNTVAFYSRIDRKHFSVEKLFQPVIQKEGQPVSVSADLRQRLCVQCHAPEATGALHSADDHTPIGANEGRSCLSCHHPHSLAVRERLSPCRPAKK